jgi:monovalent cation:H+ antiporter, CPA1 family
LQALLGGGVCGVLGTIIEARTAATTRSLDALKLQYPEHAEALESRFLQQSGLRLLISRYKDLLDEGLIGRELFDDLEREQAAGRQFAGDDAPLDLGLRTEELLHNFEMFAGLGSEELSALARLFRPRLLVPEEVVIRKGDRGSEMFLISSGAVEVVLKDTRIRLGSGDFFGELALISRGRRQADVVALGYCRVLVLGTADFRRFLREYPHAAAEINRVAETRRRSNDARVAG